MDKPVRKRFYWKPVFTHRAYYFGGAGNATLGTTRRYIDQQGTGERPHKYRPSRSTLLTLCDYEEEAQRLCVQISGFVLTLQTASAIRK